MTQNILYSFRRCPYAMRARLAIAYAGVQVELREVVLKNKPLQLLQISSKATVPVLQTSIDEDVHIIDESLDVMVWALHQTDPNDWLENEAAQLLFVNRFEADFKPWLDKYKYADRHIEFPMEYYQEQCCEVLEVLEQRLNETPFLFSQKMGLSDAAIFPFVRQFAHVDKQWFSQTDYPKVQRWLDKHIESALFQSIMTKYSAWQPEQPIVIFPATQ